MLSRALSRVRKKREVRYFVSYAREDEALKNDLLSRLEPLLKLAKNYRFEGWHDGQIRLDERWHDAIQKAIVACDFGLLLVSSRFLASTYIGDHELPHFVAEESFQLDGQKRAAAVALRRVPFGEHSDLKGLREQQIFRDKRYRAYEEIGGAPHREKEAFAHQLFDKIIEMLDAELPNSGFPVSSLQSSMEKERDDRSQQPRLFLKQDDDNAEYANPRVITGHIYYPRQIAQSEGPLPIWFSASFLPVETDGLPLRRVQVQVDLPAGLVPTEVLGAQTPHRLETGIEIVSRGPYRSMARWEVRSCLPTATIQDRNAVAEGPPLFELPGAKLGQMLQLRLVAFANKDFSLSDENSPVNPASNIARIKRAIMRRLQLKQIGDPSDAGEIVLVRTRNFVCEEAK